MTRRQAGLTMIEVLIASSVFLALMASLFFFFYSSVVKGSARLGFDISVKTLDAELEKLVDQAKRSDVHGIAATPWGDNGRILSIQPQAGLDSLGSVSWEETLHLYWKKNDGKKLFYADIGKDEAHAAGVELDSRYPTKPTPAQLMALATARDNRAKILQTGFVQFDISKKWESSPEALWIHWKAENPQMPVQTYTTEASIWLETP